MVSHSVACQLWLNIDLKASLLKMYGMGW